MKLASGVEPGWVDIMPRNLVTLQVLTWLYSEQTDTRNFSDRVTFVTGDLGNIGQRINNIRLKSEDVRLILFPRNGSVFSDLLDSDPYSEVKCGLQQTIDYYVILKK